MQVLTHSLPEYRMPWFLDRWTAHMLRPSTGRTFSTWTRVNNLNGVVCGCKSISPWISDSEPLETCGTAAPRGVNLGWITTVNRRRLSHVPHRDHFHEKKSLYFIVFALFRTFGAGYYEYLGSILSQALGHGYPSTCYYISHLPLFSSGIWHALPRSPPNV